MLHNLLIGFINVFMPMNLFFVILGTFLGLVVGAMPGLSATMAIALLVPVTFAMRPETGVSMLAAIYM